MLRFLARKLIQGLLYLIDRDYRLAEIISDNNDLKFTHTKEVNFQSDFAPANNVFRTVPYDAWQIKTRNTELVAADKHLIQTPAGLRWVQDLQVGDLISTKFGNEELILVKNLNVRTHMFDLEIDSEDHLYYCNNVLSHNTTTAAGYLLWYAMFKPDSTILVAAHKYSGVQEIMQRIRYAYELCPDHIRAGVTSYNKGSMEFDNGSRIVAQATTENTGRGMSITLLYLDEFAFVRPTIAKEFWTSISPTLSTGGGAIITSTPNSDEDQFALLWKGANKTEDEYGNETALGINGFHAYSADWRRHPDRDQQWADEEMGRIGEERFRREHLNCFLIFDETLIAATTLIDMEGMEPIRRSGQVRWYAEPKPGMIYTVALDPSLGTGGDPAAIQVFEANTTKQIAEWKHNKTSVSGQIRTFVEIIQYVGEKCRDANSVYYSVENNTLGEAALVSINEYGEHNIPGVFLSEPKRSQGSSRKGFTTTNKSKLAACAKLKNLVESKTLTVFSKSLISEFKHFVAHGASYAAKPGEHDDLVMALLLTVRMFQLLKDYHKELSTQFSDFGDIEIAPMPFIAMF
jgi:hypothetical protein